MVDFSACVAAQCLTREAANEAYPEATVSPDRVPLARRPDAIAARLWLSLGRRRLADVTEVAPGRAGTDMASPRHPLYAVGRKH